MAGFTPATSVNSMRTAICTSATARRTWSIVGGYNVYPREVDEVLFSHPDVKEAASTGIADSYYGEKVCAFVVLKPAARADADSLIEHCKKNLAPYKVPALIRLVDELPRTTVGKIDKLALRERLAAQGQGGERIQKAL